MQESFTSISFRLLPSIYSFHSLPKISLCTLISLTNVPNCNPNRANRAGLGFTNFNSQPSYLENPYISNWAKPAEANNCRSKLNFDKMCLTMKVGGYSEKQLEHGGSTTKRIDITKLLKLTLKHKQFCLLNSAKYDVGQALRNSKTRFERLPTWVSVTAAVRGLLTSPPPSISLSL